MSNVVEVQMRQPSATLRRVPACLAAAAALGLGIGGAARRLADPFPLGRPRQHLDDLRIEGDAPVFLIVLGVPHDCPGSIKPNIAPVEVEDFAGARPFEYREKIPAAICRRSCPQQPLGLFDRGIFGAAVVEFWSDEIRLVAPALPVCVVEHAGEPLDHHPNDLARHVGFAMLGIGEVGLDDCVDRLLIDLAAVETTEEIDQARRMALTALALGTDDGFALRTGRLTRFDVGDCRLLEGAAGLAGDLVEDVALDFLDYLFRRACCRSSRSLVDAVACVRIGATHAPEFRATGLRGNELEVEHERLALMMVVTSSSVKRSVGLLLMGLRPILEQNFRRVSGLSRNNSATSSRECSSGNIGGSIALTSTI